MNAQEKEPVELVGRAASFVVQGDGDGAYLLWDAKGIMRMAHNEEELGAKVVTALRDPTVPRLDRAQSPAGGKWAQTAAKILDSMGVPNTDDVDRTAVAVVIYLVEFEPNLDVVLWPIRGGPKSARGFVAIGKRLAAIAADQSQPRVPAGAPVDLGASLLERGSDLVAQLVPAFLADTGSE